MAFVSQLFILAEVLLIGAHAAGLTDFQLTEEIKGWVLAVVNAIFGVLSTLGIVQDPTVEGITDSARSLNRNEPLTEEQKQKLY